GPGSGAARSPDGRANSEVGPRVRGTTTGRDGSVSVRPAAADRAGSAHQVRRAQQFGRDRLSHILVTGP
ncbi:hypothetical protein, partial [Streptomyces cinereoruber]